MLFRSLLEYSDRNPGYSQIGGLVNYLNFALKVSKMKGRAMKVGHGRPASTFKKFMSNVEEIRKACAGRFKGIKNQRSNSSLPYAYGTWCKLAAKAKTIVRNTLKRMLKSVAPVRILDRMVGNVQKRKGFHIVTCAHYIINPKKTAELIRNKVAGWSAVTGVKLDSAPIVKRWLALASKAKEIIGKASTKWKFPKEKYHYRHRRSEKVARKTFRKYYGKRISIKKMRIHEKRWVVTTNALGIPVRRHHVGVIVYKMPNEPWCRQQGFSYTEPYKGHGRYQKVEKVYVKRYIRWQRCR